MKTVVEGEPVEFKPLTISFTLETQEEVNAFYRAGDSAYRDSHSGTVEESIGNSMKNAVQDWIRNA